MKMTAAVLAVALVASATVRAQAPQAAQTAIEALILAEDRRASQPGDYERLAAIAESHSEPGMRARAVRALGRLEQRHPAGAVPADLIERALRDRDPLVRGTAAFALAQSVNALDAAAKAPRRATLLAQLRQEAHDAAAAAMLESAARLADAASIAEVEAAGLAHAASGPRAGALASALEILARRAGKPGVLSPRAVSWLRAAATAQALSPVDRRTAAQALLTSRALDAAFATTLFKSDDFQMRRLAILAVAGAPDGAPMVTSALSDADPHVRYEAVRAVARRGAEACPALLGAMTDGDAHVALAAIDALARCADASVAAALTNLAATPGGLNWHRASHALVSLASVDAARARELMPKHVTDAAWPVRMYAAQAAARLGDDQLLATFAADRHPNVREAAITGLVARAQTPATADAVRPLLKTAVMSALAERRDPQLLRTAAGAVAVTGDAPAFKDVLLAAIDALDAAGADTTVDARVALVEALKLAAPADAPPPAPKPRELMSPSMQELLRLPTRARITMVRGGSIDLELLPGEAPATVARFARLANAGYYDGLTFHRVVPNFVVQGGSPWANEYAGAPRFQRDEVGFARHERGAVGISTRGRDTGDAQIFIDLVDLPRLNHDYTVFARVVSGMDVVDRILEADVIQRISILK